MLILSAAGDWYRLTPSPTEGAIVRVAVALAEDTRVVAVSVSQYSVCRCWVLVVLKEVVGACRVTLEDGVSGPEREETTDEEANGTDVDRKVYCEERDLVLAIDTKGVLVGARQCSLTEPPPGG